jgi:hypothetical protein
MLVQKSKRNRAAARTDVEHARRVEPAQPLEATLDDDLGLGPRNESAPVDLQQQPPEAPLAEDVGDGLAARATRDQLPERGQLAGVQRPIDIHVELDPLAAERVREQKLGVEARRVGALRGEVIVRAAEDLPDRHVAATSSARRRSSAWSASVKLSSWPGSTFSRLTVTLTRWSVTRLSG